ncbi:hypothetical protein GBA52_028909 [Prunus armeniaca]|nr:hypothetical protein GBA52_028909 [Prunus armeniaca]
MSARTNNTGDGMGVTETLGIWKFSMSHLTRHLYAYPSTLATAAISAIFASTHIPNALRSPIL